MMPKGKYRGQRQCMSGAAGTEANRQGDAPSGIHCADYGDVSIEKPRGKERVGAAPNVKEAFFLFRTAKGQSAFEFLLIVAFLTLVFVSLFSLVNSRLADETQGRVEATAADIAGLVVDQVVLAAGLNDGYSSTFTIPEVINGQSYSLDLVDGREVVVVYKDYEHVVFLPANVTGNVTFGENAIGKRDGRVHINS